MSTLSPEYRIRYATPEQAARAAAAFGSDLRPGVRVRVDGSVLILRAPPAATLLLRALTRAGRFARRLLKRDR